MTARIGVQKGPPTTDFYLHADRVSQSKAGNYTTVRLYVQAVSQGASYGSSNYAFTHRGAIDDVGHGDYSVSNLPSGYGPGAQRWMAHVGDFNVGHNADGTRGAVTLRMSNITSDSDLSGVWTAAWDDFPTIVNPPDAPSSATAARNSDTQATVGWVRTSDGNKQWTGVYIDRWSVVFGTWARVATVTGTGTSWVDDNITANSQYKYRIASYNSDGTSTYVETNTIITTPAAPITVVAEKQANLDIVISWVNQAAYSTLVDIYDNGVKVGTTVSTGLSKWTHVGPNTAVTHTYTLKAVSGSLSSGFSAASNTVQLQAPPLAPADVKFNYPVVDVGNVMPRPVLSWRHNPVDASTQTKRRLRFRKQGTSTWTTDTIWTTSSQETTNNEIVTDLGDYFGYLPGVYEFQVMTWGAHATESPWSNTAVITLESNPNVAIISPTPGQVVDRSRLTVKWTYSQAQSRPQQKVSFVLKNTITGQVVWSGDLTGTATTYQIPYTLIDGQSYTLKLTAYSNTSVPTVTQQVINFSIDYAEPLLPVLIGSSEDSLGSHQLTISNPSSGEPVVANRVYRNVKQGSDWMKLTGNPVPSETINYAPSIVGDGTWAEVRRNYFVNPLVTSVGGFSVTGGQGTVSAVSGAVRFTASSNSWFELRADSGNFPVSTAGRVLMRVRASKALTATARLRAGSGVAVSLGTAWSWLDMTVTSGTGGSALSGLSLTPTSGHAAGDWVEIDRVLYAVAGDSGPFFDPSAPFGSVDPDMRQRHVGAIGNSESVMEGERVAGLTASYCVAIVSTKAGKPAVRLISTNTTNNDSYVWITIPAGAARTSGTVLGTVHLDAPLTGALYGSRRLGALVTSPEQATLAPNVAGSHPVRNYYPTALTSLYWVRWYHGGAKGSGDVWWTDVGLYAGNYTGDWFDGNTLGYTDTDGMVVTHSYKNGLAVKTRSYPEFRVDEWELVGEYPSNVTIIDKQGLSRGKTAYRVEAISGIPSISASAIVLTADSPWVWIGAGNNFELTLGIPWNFALSLTAGLVEDELFWFDGRDKPVSVTGTARSQTLSVSGTLDPTGQEGSTWEQLQEFFMTPGLKIYRDRDGRRVYGSIKSGSQARGNQNSGRTNKRNKYDVSFIVEEADNVSY